MTTVSIINYSEKYHIVEADNCYVFVRTLISTKRVILGLLKVQLLVWGRSIKKYVLESFNDK